jgi:hypothetical protein
MLLFRKFEFPEKKLIIYIFSLVIVHIHHCQMSTCTSNLVSPKQLVTEKIESIKDVPPVERERDSKLPEKS